MFSSCNALTSIPWNDFDIDTSECTNMSYMFNGCYDLTVLDLSSMDTSKVTDMRSMFYNTDIINLDLSNFNTSKVTNMRYMFRSITSLTTLDLSNFDTSNVTDMGEMFYYCTNLQEIICPNGFDLSSCTYILHMFGSNDVYTGEPLHLKNIPQDLDITNIWGTKGIHYVIDSYLD